MPTIDTRTEGPKPGPVEEQHRINSIDQLRGVALLGILLINIVGMALPNPAYFDPSGYGGDTGLNLRVFFVNSVLFEGTMRALFSMLFGAGVLLFARKKEDDGIWSELTGAWYKRCIWLIVFGLIHAYLLIRPGEILYYYGIVGMFIFPVRKASAKKLIGFSIFLFTTITLLNIYDSRKVMYLQQEATMAAAMEERGAELSTEQKRAMEAWNQKLTDYKPDVISREKVVMDMRLGYLSAVRTMAPISLFFQTTFFFRHGFLDVLSMMLLGMGLFKLGIFHGERKAAFYGLMVLVGYGVGIPLNWYETTFYMNDNFSVVSYFTNQITYELGRIFTTMGHVGTVMLCARSAIPGFLKSAMAAVGRMALTNYVMHTVIATTLFGAFRQFGQWQRFELYYLVLLIWLFQLIVSPIWLSYFLFGPLEWMWRWLTYGNRPPFKKH